MPFGSGLSCFPSSLGTPGLGPCGLRSLSRAPRRFRATALVRARRGRLSENLRGEGSEQRTHVVQCVRVLFQQMPDGRQVVRPPRESKRRRDPV